MTDTLQDLLDILSARLHGGDAGADHLPELTFPAVPPDPLGSAIPKTLGPFHWRQMLQQVTFPGEPRPMLDFGCGAAERRDEMEGHGLRWIGVDIPMSREARARSDYERLAYYEGGTLPFRDDSFFLVLSTQTFEHVHDPHLTLEELARVTEPGGVLVGSTSAMEPFHSNSTFTYTAKLFAEALDEHGFRVESLAPGIDAFTLLARRLAMQFGRLEEVRALNPFFAKTSPLHALIEELGQRQQIKPVRINALELELCGMFHFLARRAG